MRSERIEVRGLRIEAEVGRVPYSPPSPALPAEGREPILKNNVGAGLRHAQPAHNAQVPFDQ